MLEATALFAAAPRPVLERLAAETREITAPAGETLIHEGDRADALYVLRTGAVAVRAGERELATLGPGSWFGEIGLLEGVPRTATVYAIEECTLLRIDGEAFLEALTTAPLSSTALEGARARYAAVRAPRAAATGGGLKSFRRARGGGGTAIFGFAVGLLGTSYFLGVPLAQTTVRDALDSALIALTASGCETPRLDAEVLLAAALGVDRAALIADPAAGSSRSRSASTCAAARGASRWRTSSGARGSGGWSWRSTRACWCRGPRPSTWWRRRSGCRRARGWSTSAPGRGRSRWRWPTSGPTCAWWRPSRARARWPWRGPTARDSGSRSSGSRATCWSRCPARSTRSSPTLRT